MNVLLEVQHLRVGFPIWGGVFSRKVAEVLAVDDVSFQVHEGETLGLVGESGCGKTTVGKAVVHLLRATVPDVRLEGRILLHTPRGPVDLLSLNKREMRPFRSQVQMIFQDPYASLNPRMTVRQTLDRTLRLHGTRTAAERYREVGRLLERVGLQAADADRYPHEFSGGQRQRIGIARALAPRPRLIVADEPVSALDVSVQAQVINLLQDLQEEYQLAFLFVAHDLSVVYHISHRIAVMYLGKLIELGPAESVYREPAHPYTRALLAAAPHPDPGGKITSRYTLKGEIPTPLHRPSGCAFRTRCPIAKPECATFVPPLEPKETGQSAACPYV